MKWEDSVAAVPSPPMAGFGGHPTQTPGRNAGMSEPSLVLAELAAFCFMSECELRDGHQLRAATTALRDAVHSTVSRGGRPRLRAESGGGEVHGRKDAAVSAYYAAS